MTHLRQMVESAGALVYTIRQDDDLTAALSYRTGVHADDLIKKRC